MPALAAPPDQVSLDLSARLQTLADRLAGSEAGDLSAAILIAQAGLDRVQGVAGLQSPPAALPADQPPAVAPTARRLNMRLALTMLSQAYGDEQSAAVVAAQTEPSLSALVLTHGSSSLDDLLRLAQDQGLPFEEDGGALLLRVPLVIWPGAGLALEAGDEVRLSRPDGAFLVNFGDLRVRGATIASAGGPNPKVSRFNPFVATVGEGTIDVQGGHFVGLGFGDTLKFAGLSILRSLVAQPARASRIEDSTFTDVLSVAVGSDAGILLRGNLFHDARGPALVVAGTNGARITGNIFSGRMPTNAIRLEGGSEEGVIAGNVILGGNRAGIVVRDSSAGVTVAGNIVWKRDGSGIVFTEADCGRVEGNLVIENARKGIEMRHSANGMVLSNQILSNENAAIWVSDQAPGAVTVVTRNEIAFNGAGLASARGESLLLDGNDLSGQFLQFLSGDLTPQSPHLAGNTTGQVPMVLSTAGRSDPPSTLPTCFG